MLLEIHAHTSKHSKCSLLDPLILIKSLIKKKLQGVIITEHHYLWTYEEIKELRLRAEVENNFLILSAQEVETDIGHVLVYGAENTIPDFIELENLRKKYPGVALILAHPFRNNKNPSEELLTNQYIDAIEIFNSNQTPKENFLGLRSWHKYKYIATGGSDTHIESTAGVYPTQFDHNIENIQDIVIEIKKGRCRPFFKEIPKAGTNIIITEIVIGTKGDNENRDRIILKNISDNKKWEKSNQTIKIVNTLYNNGFDEGIFRVPKIIDIVHEEKLILEEGQRGKNLYELLLTVDTSVGQKYYELAAQWLAKLHNLRLKISSIDEVIKREKNRFEKYTEAFSKSNNPHQKKAVILINFIKEKEYEMFEKEKDFFIQNHGDYHPKNIIIGQDKMQDISTVFISVIDFDNSIVFPRAFDVGYFLSQFQNQFSENPNILKKYNEKQFVKIYSEVAEDLRGDFIEQVNLFKLRANISIASFLINVGKGESQELNKVIENSLELKKILEEK